MILLLSAVALIGATGCPAPCNYPTPGCLSVQHDPVMNRPYHLYVPARYRDEVRWPLVITCHGTKPFDTAELQIDEWKGLAEEKGFLVAAPELVGTTAKSGDKDKQIQRQLDDENTILATVRAVRAARSIDDTRIFLTGWSAGGYAVLFTGLKHPDIFRALAIMQGNFNPAYFELCIPFIDRYQPILITYGNLDPLVPKEQSEALIDWLHSNELQPEVRERIGAHRRDPEPVYGFLADTVRHHPWIRVNVQDNPADEMHVKFGVRTSFEPQKYLWDFGDQSRSPVAEPEHTYQQPGMYTVRVALYSSSGAKPYVRQIQLQVPRIHLGVAQSAPAK